MGPCEKFVLFVVTFSVTPAGFEELFDITFSAESVITRLKSEPEMGLSEIDKP